MDCNDPNTLPLRESLENGNLRAQLCIIFFVFFVSLFLPALTITNNNSPTQINPGIGSGQNVLLYGYQAFLKSWAAVIAIPFGPIFSLSSPLFIICFYGLYFQKPWVILTCISLVGIMVAWPIFLPNRPDGELVTMPGGRMGLGYYLWLTCGIWMLVIAHIQRNKNLKNFPDVVIPFKKSPQFIYIMVGLFLILLILFQVFILHYALPFSNEIFIQ